MKRIIAGLALLFAVSIGHAQLTPMLLVNGSGVPFPGGSGVGAVNYGLTEIIPMCSNNGAAPYTICAFSGGGGGDSITSPNNTLTVGGTSTATTLDINLATPNVWTGMPTFSAPATSTAPSVLFNGTPATGGATVPPDVYLNAATGSPTFGSGGVVEGINTPSGSNALEVYNAGGTAGLTISNQGVISVRQYKTLGNGCSAVGTTASPSLVACSTFSSGAFSCSPSASAATCVITATMVTANSQIFVNLVADQATRLGIGACNTSPTLVPAILVASHTAGTGFTINMPTITTNPACFVYEILN